MKKPDEVVRRVGTTELSKRLGLTRVTLYRLVRDGKMPPSHYMRGKRMWFLSEIEEWEKQEMATSKPQTFKKAVSK